MKIKVILGVLLATLVFVACGNVDAKTNGDDSGLVWHENLETAIEVAKVEGKEVFVNFTGSDWCRWCIKLNDEVFSQTKFAEYAKDNLVLVRLDFPRYKKLPQATVKYNYAIANKFGVSGYPTNVLLNSKGDYVGAIGYQPGGPAKYVETLQKVYKR